jgi:AAA domain
MPLDALTYCNADGLDLRNEHDVRWLERQVCAAKANLIVVDSLARLCPGADEDRSKDMVPVMAALGRIARATNAGVLVVHHRGKGEGGYRGSSGIRDQCDALFVLDRSSEDRELRTIAVGDAGKFRLDVEPAPRAFRLGAVAGRVTINAADVPPPAPKPPTAAEKMRAQVVAVVAQQGDLTRAVIAEQVGVEPGDRTFKRALADAVKLGLLAQPKRGTYREGPKWPSVIGGGPNGPSLPEPDPRLC